MVHRLVRIARWHACLQARSATRGVVPTKGNSGSIDAEFPGSPTFSDDTALTIATCEAIVSERGRVVPERVAERFRVWFDENRVAGVGSATLKAPRYYIDATRRT
jgi:ADP-ribosylglycohydrolase